MNSVITLSDFLDSTDSFLRGHLEVCCSTSSLMLRNLIMFPAVPPSYEDRKMAYYQTIREVVRGSFELYQEKLARLIEKWDAASFNDVSNMAAGVLSGGTPSPLTVALIMDNKDYFWAHRYDQLFYNNPEIALEVACLFGAQQIAESLLQKMNSDFVTPENAYLLGYVCASENMPWIRALALKMVEAKIEEPLTIYATFVDYDITEEVRTLFKTGKVSSATSTNKIR